jgi:hypothetical protein
LDDMKILLKDFKGLVLFWVKILSQLDIKKAL